MAERSSGSLEPKPVLTKKTRWPSLFVKSKAFIESCVDGEAEPKDPNTSNDVRPGTPPTPARQQARGIKIEISATGIVLIINLALVIVAGALSPSEITRETFVYTPLYRGAWSVSEHWATGLHLAINVLSTVVLAASNYYMQCMSAPSREDVDVAHSQHMWLDIVCSSIRNLQFMSPRRKFIWVALLLTSLPFHLLYNSAISSVYGSAEFGMLVAPSDFDFNKTLSPSRFHGCFEKNIGKDLLEFNSAMSRGEFTLRTTEECQTDINYGDRPGLDYSQSTVVLLSNSSISDEPSLLYGGISGYSGFSTNYPFRAMAWSLPLLEVTVPSPYGPLTIDKYNFTKTPAFHQYAMFNEDLTKLKEYFVGHLSSDIDSGKLRAHLSNAEIWKNATWAQSIALTQNATCAYQSPGRAPSADITEVQIEGCLSQKVRGKSQVAISPAIYLLILICNLVKLVCMWQASREKRVDVLFTTGDAVASYLSHPDKTTAEQCFMSKEIAIQRREPWVSKVSSKWILRNNAACPHPLKTDCPQGLPARKRLHQAASIWQWLLSMSLYVYSTSLFCLMNLPVQLDQKVNKLALHSYFLSMGICAGLLITYSTMGGYESKFHIKNVWGPYDLDTDLGPLAMALIANSPQLCLSLVYFFFNDLLTNMLGAAEYNDFSYDRKALRVSQPIGDQRSTYYLSLPYKYSVPQLILSTLLHWIFSQMIGFYQSVRYDISGKVESKFARLQISPGMAVFAIPVGALIPFMALVVGIRRFKTNMPLAASCSLAISAACHPPLGDDAAALKPVMWGEVPNEYNVLERQRYLEQETGDSSEVESSEDTDQHQARGDVNSGSFVPNASAIDHSCDGSNDIVYGHCSFTSYEVVLPREGRLYA